MKKSEHITNSEEETRNFATHFAKTLKAGSILLLEGELGAGKTTFVQGLAKGLEVPGSVMVHSPTFTLINEYPGHLPLVHIDLYRVDHLKQLQELGLDEYMDGKKVMVVEWAQKAAQYWPSHAIHVHLESLDSHVRRIMLTIPKEKI